MHTELLSDCSQALYKEKKKLCTLAYVCNGLNLLNTSQLATLRAMLFLCCDKNVHKMISNNTGIKRVPHVHQLTSPSAVIPHSGLPCCETVFKSMIMKAHMYELSCGLQRIASDIVLSFAFSMLERANNSILKVQSTLFGTNSPYINFEKTARCH